MKPNITFYPSAINPTDCINNGWELVKSNYGMFFGMAILTLILTGCLSCISWFLMGPVLGGVYYVLLRAMRNEPYDFGMMFKGFEKFLPLMVIGLLLAVPAIIGNIVSFTVDLGRIGMESAGRDNDVAPLLAGGLGIFSIIFALIIMVAGAVWGILLIFAVPLAMEYDLGPMEAIKLSAKAAAANIGGIIVLVILQVLMMLVGFLVLCVGYFLVLPVIYASSAFAYRMVFPSMTPAEYQQTPPPPDTYGDFGRGMA